MKNKILTYVLIILLIGLGGFFIYDKYLSNPDVSETDKTCEAKICEVKYPYASLEFNNDVQRVVNLTGDAEISIKADGVYLILYKSQEENVQTIYNNLMANGDIKLDLDNVVFAYPLTMGMTSYANYFAFIHNDGTVSVLSMGEIMTSGVVEVKKIAGLANIINIYNTEAPGEIVGVDFAAVAVDINGVKHEINIPGVDQW